jgi:hypothetical protein
VRLLAKACLLAWLIVAVAWIPAARAQSPQSDADQSTRLTDYLHAHRLPLVGAQVYNSTGGRSVMLYGYTATDFGKTDAETKTRRFLQDSAVAISNHIHVRPELSSMRSYAPSGSPSYSGSGQYSGSGSNSGSGEASSPDVDAYKNQNTAQQQYINQQAQQYMNQGTSPLAGNLGSLLPLLGGLAIGIGGGSGFGMGMSPGFGGFGGGGYSGSPFGFGGGTPYGSYGGGPSPYGGYPSGPNPYTNPANPYP